jgi:adenylate cyclase
MLTEPLPRKLAAILYADAVGYSRLTRSDENGAHRRLGAYLDLIAEAVEGHDGHVVHYAGDAVLADFGAVVDAVSCAADIQRHIARKNQDLPEKDRLEFRIGVNLGDVIVDRGDIYGDGVNVAARLESLAEPGGICVSGAVLAAMANRLPFACHYLGEQKIKNIEVPVRVYRVCWDSSSTREQSDQHPIEISNRPSLVVFPFVNASGDDSLDYLSDGFTEDIITELSRFRDVFVISRNSSFTYKGKRIRPPDVGMELGVDYLVEGSVRMAGKHIRVTAQLIDVRTDHLIWAERYDREFTDLYVVQDQITRSVASTVVGRLVMSAEDRAAHTASQDMRAWDYVLRAQHMVCDTREHNLNARRQYQQAIELDPECARAHCGLAVCHLIDWVSHWAEGPEASYEQALACVQRAVVLDQADSKAHWVMAELLLFRRDFDGTREHVAKALALNPDDADAHAIRGLYFIYTGDPAGAIDSLATAMRLNPLYPAWYLWFTGFAYYTAKNYQAALAPLREASRRNPSFISPRLKLAATHARLGNAEEAKKTVAEILSINSAYNVALEANRPFRDPADLEHYLAGLRLAGLPERFRTEATTDDTAEFPAFSSPDQRRMAEPGAS